MSIEGIDQKEVDNYFVNYFSKRNLESVLLTKLINDLSGDDGLFKDKKIPVLIFEVYYNSIESMVIDDFRHIFLHRRLEKYAKRKMKINKLKNGK